MAFSKTLNITCTSQTAHQLAISFLQPWVQFSTMSHRLYHPHAQLPRVSLHLPFSPLPPWAQPPSGPRLPPSTAQPGQPGDGLKHQPVVTCSHSRHRHTALLQRRATLALPWLPGLPFSGTDVPASQTKSNFSYPLSLPDCFLLR